MENVKHDQECTECDFATDERLNYFTGQFLAERDFRAEQEYQIGKHRQHNRYLHGYGTVCGLKLVEHPNSDCRDRFVILEPGLALDCCGREIVVKEKVYIDLVKLFVAQNIDLNNIKPEEQNHLLFSLCYEECKTEFVPALYSECGCDEFGCDANRIVEGFEVKLQLLKDLPKPLHEEPDGVNLDWITTLSLDKAFRVVLDPKGERIYVLTSAGQDQILVYDAKHHCLLKSIPVDGQGVDLAIAPTGKFLYVIRDTSPNNKYVLRVVNVSNLNNHVNGIDLPLADGGLNNLPQVEVSKATDGRVYVLDPHTTQPQVTIWKDSINFLAPNAAKANIDAAKFADITPASPPTVIGSNSVAIAISPNGTWLFIADGTDNNIRVSKVDTLTLPIPSQVTALISLSESPKLLAVSDDSKRLYVVTVPASGDKKIRAFNIQEGNPPTVAELAVLGATELGIKIGIDEPVAIAASPSGKWAYILLKDNSSHPKGIIKVVDGDKIATDPTKALLPGVFSVVSDPQDLVLEPEGNRLYVAGKGNSLPPSCGGVSVIDVKETQCSELIWRALEGCPECPEDNCVPLAIVEKYVENYKKQDAAITNARIENRKFRPLVTSTDTLKQLVMCALEGKTGGKDGKDGKNGSAGSKWLDGSTDPTNAVTANSGDYYLNTTTDDVFRKEINGFWTRIVNIKGNPGQDGNSGEGLEVGLTQIEALSWTHNTSNNRLVNITLKNGGGEVPGIVIAFTNPVLVSDPSSPLKPPNQIDADHVFQVLVEHDPTLKRLGVVCRCPIKGRIIPVEVRVDINNSKLITRAQEVTGPMAEAAAFIFDSRFSKFGSKEGNQINEIWVRLHGDFVIDKFDKAIDAEFVRAELPTGDRPRDIKVGIQGGVFESWFWIGKRPEE